MIVSPVWMHQYLSGKLALLSVSLEENPETGGVFQYFVQAVNVHMYVIIDEKWKKPHKPERVSLNYILYYILCSLMINLLITFSINHFIYKKLVKSANHTSPNRQFEW